MGAGQVLKMGWILLVFCLLGCRGDSAATVVVEFWAMGREGEVAPQLLPEFERRHPGVRVKVQQIPWGAAHEKLLTAYAGDAMPDIFQLGNTWIPEFVALRAVEPLDAWIAGSPDFDLEDYFPGILATNVIAGGLYGAPWYVDTRLLFYRRDLLARAGYDQPPDSWDEWLTAMARLKAQAGADRYAILLPMNEWQLPVILALQRGAELLKDDSRYGNFRSPEFRRAFAFYLALFRQGLAPAVGETQIANLYQEFASAYFSLYISGPWNIGEFTRRLPPAVQDQWSTAPMPGPDARHPGVSLAGGASLAIYRGSPRKPEAWQLLAYLSEPAQQLAFYRLTGDLPARRTAWREGALADMPPTRAFWTQLQALAATPRIPEWERITSKIAQYAEAAIRGALTVDEALAALDRDVDGILEKRRWLLGKSR